MFSNTIISLLDNNEVKEHAQFPLGIRLFQLYDFLSRMSVFITIHYRE